MTLDLVRALSEVTGARVAPEPWPFEERAEARLDVRVAEIVADASGAFLLRGQYYVASQDGSGRDRSREFRIAIPLAPRRGPGAIAAARGAGDRGAGAGDRGERALALGRSSQSRNAATTSGAASTTVSGDG